MSIFLSSAVGGQRIASHCKLLFALSVALIAGTCGAHAQWSGDVVNTGNLVVDQSVIVDGSTQLTGGGVVTLSSTSPSSLTQIDGNPAQPAGSTDLVNVDNTITGSGYIGGGTVGTPGVMEFQNQGTVIATGTDTIFINPNSTQGMTNSGLIEAQSGGSLGIYGPGGSGILTPVNNSGGIIEATGTGPVGEPYYGPIAPWDEPFIHGQAIPVSSAVEMNAINLTGGNLAAQNGGILIFDNGSTIQNAAVSLSGNYAQAWVGFIGATAPDVTFTSVSFSGDGSAGQALWVFGYGPGGGFTNFNNVSLFNGIAANLIQAQVMVTGTLNNAGTINFGDPTNPIGAQTSMYLSGQVVLTGGGTVNLQGAGGAPQNFIDGNYNDPLGTDTLVNVNNTITGIGIIGGGSSPSLYPGGMPGLIELVNEGEIVAGTNDYIQVDPDWNRGVVNTGTMEALGGGYLQYVGGLNQSNLLSPIENDSGLIRASGTGLYGNTPFGYSTPWDHPGSKSVPSPQSSMVELSTVDLTGGTLSAANSGILLFDTATTIENAAISLSGSYSQVWVGAPYGQPATPDVTFNNVTFSGDGSTGQGLWVFGQGFVNPEFGDNGYTNFNNVSFLNGLNTYLYGAQALVTGTLNNTGTIYFDDPEYPTGQPSFLFISGTVALTGGGTINFLNSNGYPPDQIEGYFNDLPGTDTLVNVNNTITGSGYIGGGNNPFPYTGQPGYLELINQGAIQAQTNDFLEIDPDWNRGIVNSGTLEALAGGYLLLEGGQNNSGLLSPIDNTGGLILASGTGGSGDGPNGALYPIDDPLPFHWPGWPTAPRPTGWVPPGSSSTVELTTVSLTGGTLSAANSGILIFDTATTMQNAAVSLSGSYSQAWVGVYGQRGASDVTFNNVSFSGDGSAEQGLWVFGINTVDPEYGDNGYTNFNNVSFLNGFDTYLYGAQALVTGPLDNTGTIYFDDPKTPSDLPSFLFISGTVALTGGGTIDLLNTNGGYEHQIDGYYNDPPGTDTLVNVNNTITGTGFIGGGNNPFPYNGTAGNIELINLATIQAQTNDFLEIDPDWNRGVVNSGTIQALAGGYLLLYGGQNDFGLLSPINNAGGLILASGTGGYGDNPYGSLYPEDDPLPFHWPGWPTAPRPTGWTPPDASSTVELTTVDLTGGTLSAANSGILLFDTATTIENATISLSGSYSQAWAGAFYGQPATPDVTFNNVSFSGDGSVGQGLWVFGQGFVNPEFGDNGYTNFNNVSFLNGLNTYLYGAQALVTGTLNNTGTIYFDDPEYPTGQPSFLFISGTVALTGGGTINLLNTSGYPQDQIEAFYFDQPSIDTLVNVNNTITGTGFIGGGNSPFPYSGQPGYLELINQGTIQAQTNDLLVIDPDWNRGVVNSGTIQALAGGYLLLYGGQNNFGLLSPIDNTGGLILASGTGGYGNSQYGALYPIDDPLPFHWPGWPTAPRPTGWTSPGSSSVVELATVDLTGGTLSAANSGILLFDTATTIENAAISLSGSYSQAWVSNYFGLPATPDVTFNNVTFSGDGSTGQGLWVFGQGFVNPEFGDNGYTNFNNVSLLNGLNTYLYGAQAMVTGTLNNTGTIYFDDPEYPTGQPSFLFISGTVALTGSGNVNLVNNGSQPGHIIDGNYQAPDVTQNVLINQDNTITGSGYIGGTPVVTTSGTTYTSAMSFVNRGTVEASSSESLVLVAGPTINGATPKPIENDGQIEIASGALMAVEGNYTQGATGNLDVGLGGTTPASISTLGSDNTYAHLDVSGTASLNGTFQVSLQNGFTPSLGDVYSVLNYTAGSGQFSNYIGLRISANLVLMPSITSSGLTLTASAVNPGTSAPLQPVTPGNSLPVTSGNTYAGITSTSNLTTGNNTVATVLGGTASSTSAVSVNFTPAGNFAASAGGPLLSDVVNFHGTGSDIFVLQIDYNEAAIMAGESEQDIFLAWLDPANNQWENAVLGNTGDNTPTQIIGAYNPSTDYVLGYYGVDPVDGRVWAVLDHNSQFGAATTDLESVPEPAPWALLGVAATLWFLVRRRTAGIAKRHA